MLHTIDIAIARSNPVPSFFVSAGDRLMVIFFGGKEIPVFFSAVLTLSADSLTADVRYPTMVSPGRPSEISVSTKIGTPKMPLTSADNTLLNIVFLFSILSFLWNCLIELSALDFGYSDCIRIFSQKQLLSFSMAVFSIRLI